VERVLLKGNEAIAEGAVRAGCAAYFGYPITPQSEILEYMSHRMPELGRVFLQAESELAAISMVYGAAATGARTMTSSSGPGISLMQETLSALAAAELPAVIVNVMRGGPGLGGILPSQADYFQATKGGGHGDYHLLVLAPASVQEAMDLTSLAFGLADRYRNPCMILADGLLGQVMEPVTSHSRMPRSVAKEWALVGRCGEARRIVKTLHLDAPSLERLNRRLALKYRHMQEHEVRYAEYRVDDADHLIVGYGTCSRVARTAVDDARAEGCKVGLFRPISLFPFPSERLAALSLRVRSVLVVEMSLGQLLEDVRLAVEGRVPVSLLGHAGGVTPSPLEIAGRLREAA
jgi:2-oxoglutarate/2-oxoacid ferredoxin oxidoreductase subunit alpha